jgi:DNA adenine methylase
MFPDKIDRLIEPFAGTAAISIRAAYMKKAERFLLNDLNRPLVDLLKMIVEDPELISTSYAALWEKQLGQERSFYDEVRADFNKTGRPDLLLYLLARCVKASVRYNANGDFNQAPDNRRRGRHPSSMRREIHLVSQLLKGKTDFSSNNFSSTVEALTPTTDLIYMDPPYQGTSGGRDSRYYSGISISSLIDFVSDLNDRGAMFILSYDGRKGTKQYGTTLPQDLGLVHIELEAGRSTQSTLLGKNDVTIESIYLSPTLMRRLGVKAARIKDLIHREPAQPQQFQLGFK